MITYRIVRAKELDEMEAKVRELLDVGWKLHGDLRFNEKRGLYFREVILPPDQFLFSFVPDAKATVSVN